MLAVRAPFSVLGGTLFAAAIFLGLSQLVGVQFEVLPAIELPTIDFTPKRVETSVENKRDKKVEREPPVPVPGPPGLRTEGPGEKLKFDDIARPPVAPPGARTKLLRADADALPIVQQKPTYPAGELQSGTEGWVRVQFSVTRIGTVRDAVVVDSEPGTAFDQAALKAIAGWRYNPRVEDGEAVERVGLQTIFRFELEN